MQEQIKKSITAAIAILLSVATHAQSKGTLLYHVVDGKREIDTVAMLDDPRYHWGGQTTTYKKTLEHTSVGHYRGKRERRYVGKRTG